MALNLSRFFKGRSQPDEAMNAAASDSNRPHESLSMNVQDRQTEAGYTATDDLWKTGDGFVAPGDVAGVRDAPGANAPGFTANDDLWKTGDGFVAPGDVAGVRDAPGVNAPGFTATDDLWKTGDGFVAPGDVAGMRDASGVNAPGVNASGVNAPGLNAPGVNPPGYTATDDLWKSSQGFVAPGDVAGAKVGPGAADTPPAILPYIESQATVEASPREAGFFRPNPAGDGTTEHFFRQNPAGEGNTAQSSAAGTGPFQPEKASSLYFEDSVRTAREAAGAGDDGSSNLMDTFGPLHAQSAAEPPTEELSSVFKANRDEADDLPGGDADSLRDMEIDI